LNCNEHVSHGHLVDSVPTYHLGLDKRLEGVDLAIVLALHELDFTKGSLADDLEGCVVLRPLAGTKETEEVCFGATHAGRLLLFARV
jgi:hypothetical protein